MSACGPAYRPPTRWPGLRRPATRTIRPRSPPPPASSATAPAEEASLQVQAGVHGEVGQREREQGEPDHPVRGEECPVDPGQVVRPDDRVLVAERDRSDRQADVPQPA